MEQTLDYCKISLHKLSGDESKPGYYNPEFKKLFGSTKVNHELNFTRAEFFKKGPEYSRGMSISGIQQKLSLVEAPDHQLTVTATNGTYILKPSPESHPNAAENEHAAMRVSALLNIDTALCGLIAFQGGELAFITKRFDRLDNGDKVHQEDLMQCMAMSSVDKYESTYEEAGRCVLEASDGKLAVVLDFVCRVILAYAMGNDDLHLKNISLQRNSENKTRYYDKLTPNYDVLFCQAFKSDEEQHRGLKFLALGVLVDDETGEEEFSANYEHFGYYTGFDFLELGRRLGLRDRPVRKFIERLKSNETNINQLIDHSLMPKEMAERAKDMFKGRLRALLEMEPATKPEE